MKMKMKIKIKNTISLAFRAIRETRIYLVPDESRTVSTKIFPGKIYMSLSIKLSKSVLTRLLEAFHVLQTCFECKFTASLHFYLTIALITFKKLKHWTSNLAPHIRLPSRKNCFRQKDGHTFFFYLFRSSEPSPT